MACPRTASEWEAWALDLGLGDPRAQALSCCSVLQQRERQSQTTTKLFSLEKLLAWKIRPTSSQEPLLLCSLIPLGDRAAAS